MISLVAARSLNNIIGKGSDIPWKVKGEQKLFKEITLGGTLIMGRITFEAIGRPLPGRHTIIVTRQAEYHQDTCSTANTIDQAIKIAQEIGKPIYIVGGGELYLQCIAMADEIHLTTIGIEVDGDVSFPEFNREEFKLESEKTYSSNINYIYQHYSRII